MSNSNKNIDYEEFLVITKDKIRTDVESYAYKNKEKEVEIKFKNRPAPYPYAAKNVQIFEKPSIVDFEHYEFTIKETNKKLFAIKKVVSFDNFYYKVFYESYNKIYSSEQLIITQNILSENKPKKLLRYFKEIAKITHKHVFIQDLIYNGLVTPAQIDTVDIEDEQFQIEGKDFTKSNIAKSLKSQYEKMTSLDATTVGAKYLQPDLQSEKINQNENIIFPFGCNLSQISAVENAINNQISIIEGPPGTGKTQTILNIIANILLEGKSLAIVSNNNSATNNVFEKLEKKGFSYLAAQLGKSDNLKGFFEKKQSQYPDFTTDLMTDSEFNELQNTVFLLKKELKDMLQKQNRKAILVSKLADLKVEKEYFQTYYTESGHTHCDIFKNNKKLKSDTINGLCFKIQNFLKNNKKLGFWFKFTSYFYYGIQNFSVFKKDKVCLIANLQKLFYDTKQIEIDNEIRLNTQAMKDFNFEDKLQSFTDKSLSLLKFTLAKRYTKVEERPFFIKENIPPKDLNLNAVEFTPNSFITEYPIILSSTFSLKSSLRDFIYDYVIIDEASQVGLDTGFLTLTCAKRVVIVGDLKQLPNILDNKCENDYEECSKRHNISQEYHFKKDNSLLASAIKVFVDAPKTLLCEHYRCHPKIINFCNKRFYNNQLVIMTKDNDEQDVLKVHMTAKGNHASDNINYRQIEEIGMFILPELKSQDVGIITPYRNQVGKLEQTFKHTLEDGSATLEIATVHKFQGRENDDIILTTVDNKISNFTANANLLNVAVSRAKNRLVLVVSDNEANDKTNIGDLINYIKYHSFDVVKSEIYSVFDMLYKENEKARRIFLEGKEKISEYDSENLMHPVIKKVLSDNNFSHLDVCTHVPLYEIIRNLDKIKNNKEKYDYVQHPNAHVDFMIYNTVDNSYLLAVEVDGYNYHKPGSRQKERDALKNEIFKEYELPLVRFSSKESEEDKRLREILEELCGISKDKSF